jgi:hypothetical protein
MQGRILAYKKPKYDKHTRKTLHIEFYVQKYGKTKIILLQNILMHSPQKDRALSTSKKEVRNNGIVI